jgi:hypothetical protein
MTRTSMPSVASASADCICSALSTVDPAGHPVGRRQLHRAGDQRDLRAQPGRGPRQGEAHLSRRPVAEVADVVHGLVGWTGGHHHAPAGQRADRARRTDRRLPGQDLPRGLDNLRWIHQATSPDPAAGQLALVGTDGGHAAVGQQAPQVVLGQPVLPHVHVHRRRQQHRGPRGQHHRRQQIVCHAGCQPGDDVGRGGRDQHQIRLVRQLDMADLGLLGGIEQVAGRRDARTASAVSGAL